MEYKIPQYCRQTGCTTNGNYTFHEFCGKLKIPQTLWKLHLLMEHQIFHEFHRIGGIVEMYFRTVESGG